MARSKRLTPSKTTKTGVVVEKNYCRKCMETKHPAEFYQTVDTFIDSNGLMSVCKDCIQDIFNKSFLTEITLEKTILRVCKLLNVKYESRAIDSLRDSIEKHEESERSFNLSFGHYLQRLSVMNKIGNDSLSNEVHLTFINQATITPEGIADLDDIETSTKEYLEDFWGHGLNFDDYEYLESELSKWQATTKCDTQPEMVLIKLICHQQNEIRKKQLRG